MMGLHSGVDTSTVAIDGVVVVDLECNRITTMEDIPPIPEPELCDLCGEMTNYCIPMLWGGIDQMKDGLYSLPEQYRKGVDKPWGEDHDLQLR
ncbi:hypothetical protein Pyn_26283 [Prunus yedoensis var. nudiflora]|uniref:Uncharacterized protein n=1 Tax=Prunus yedoensis var. nudiflora TaxID=2094558 RepID=A0A314Y953_PRUYE|nr:hypothetical protein Pyn_26283 [Prunus yedoensis var. nudiflora]